jgi:hypothetical protein
MAAQIKEKLAKENTQAAADQDKVTNSLENSYNKTKQIADKQQSLYQQQLKRRGYEIDQSGKEVKGCGCHLGAKSMSPAAKCPLDKW